MHRASRLAGCLTLVIALTAAVCACSTGYHLQASSGIETLYRMNHDGSRTIVCQMDRSGVMRECDLGDPVARRYVANKQNEKRVSAYLNQLQAQKKINHQTLEARKQHRIAQIKSARKRSHDDPIFVTVHEPSLCPEIARNVKTAQSTKQRIRDAVSKQIDTDRTIRVTTHLADVEVFLESYFRETLAFNTQTRRMVKVKAFHFKVAVQSKYLPEDHYTIEESGNWFENEHIIQRAAARVSKIILKKIGPTIPAERYKYL